RRLRPARWRLPDRASDPRHATHRRAARPARRCRALLLDGAGAGTGTGGTTMTAIVVLGPSGLALAQRLAASLPEATLHGFAPRIPDAAVRFDDVAEQLRS